MIVKAASVADVERVLRRVSAEAPLAFALEVATEKPVSEGETEALEEMAQSESVDEQGAINGIIASETISGQLDAGLNKLADRASGFAGILSAVKNVVLKAPESDVTPVR